METTKTYVIVQGTDCDGFNSGHAYKFHTEEDARDFSEDCNEGSDGLRYIPATESEMISYCEEFEISIPK